MIEEPFATIIPVMIAVIFAVMFCIVVEISNLLNQLNSQQPDVKRLARHNGGVNGQEEIPGVECGGTNSQ